jgi:TonB family protein
MKFVAITLLVLAVACKSSPADDVERYSSTLENGTGKNCSYGAMQQKNFFAYQVDKKAELQAGTVMPRYPQALKESGMMGEVVARFAVDTVGHIDPCTFRILESTHKQFSKAVESVLADIRFTPALIRGQKVRQFVEHRFTFELKDTQ